MKRKMDQNINTSHLEYVDAFLGSRFEHLAVPISIGRMRFLSEPGPANKILRKK